MTDRSKCFASTINRVDDYEDLNIKIKPKEEIETFRQEIAKLEYAINKYNIILAEYQMKYGNELFTQIENNINIENILSKNDMTSHKKRLIENISLIKEYEKNIQDKNNSLDFLNNELTSVQTNLQKKLHENDELKAEMEKIKEENSKMYKAILERKGNNLPMQNEQTQPQHITTEHSATTKEEKEQLMNAIENTKYQNEVNEGVISELREQNNQLLQDHSANMDLINRLKTDNENYLNDYDRIQKQLKDNTILLLQYEKEKNTSRAKADKLDQENAMFKKENLNYKDIYDEMEQRKNAQLNSLFNDNLSLRTTLDEYKSKVKLLDDSLSNIKFENSQLHQENQTMKFDCDHLTKIIEDSNMAVERADEKEKHIEEVIKTYKKRVDEITLEKDKIAIKLRLQENQISKISDDYMKLLKEKTNNFDSLITSSKDKYEEIILNKNDDINHLKAELVSMKIERDKYLCDYRLLKDEYDKFNNIFHEENGRYILKFEESEKKYNTMLMTYQEKTNFLTIKNDKLDSDNKSFNSQLQSAIATNRTKEGQINKLIKSEETCIAQLTKAKEQIGFYSKENQSLTQENERVKAMNDMKLKHMMEEYESKVITLENSCNFYKNQIELVEDKAFEMLKKQEGLTEKFKAEYYNTLNYYEGIIAYLDKGKGETLKGGEMETTIPEMDRDYRID